MYRWGERDCKALGHMMGEICKEGRRPKEELIWQLEFKDGLEAEFFLEGSVFSS